jgi:hypothetical protein
MKFFTIQNIFFRLDFSSEEVQNKICGGQGCNSDSLQSQIKLWSKVPEVTYIGSPAQSWLDDYFGWGKDCCQHKTSKESNQEIFCPSDFVPESATGGNKPETIFSD